jgi:hypothetical protein
LNFSVAATADAKNGFHVVRNFTPQGCGQPNKLSIHRFGTRYGECEHHTQGGCDGVRPTLLCKLA